MPPPWTVASTMPDPATVTGGFGGWDPSAIAGYGITPMSAPSSDGMTPTATGIGTPDFSSPNWFQQAGVGLNMPTFNLALGGLKTIGDIWGAMQAASIAKKQLALSTGVANANLQNQTKSYNTALTDRISSRGVAEGLSPAAVQDYIAKNSLSTPRLGG